MSDTEPNNTQDQVEPKAEDNAPINIKVRLRFHGSDLAQAVACARQNDRATDNVRFLGHLGDDTDGR